MVGWSVGWLIDGLLGWLFKRTSPWYVYFISIFSGFRITGFAANLHSIHSADEPFGISARSGHISKWYELWYGSRIYSGGNCTLKLNILIPMNDIAYHNMWSRFPILRWLLWNWFLFFSEITTDLRENWHRLILPFDLKLDFNPGEESKIQFTRQFIKKQLF